MDRAGLVGSDGETHQGIFDVTFLSGIPNMAVLAPKNKWELSDMIKFAVAHDGPSAIRYPRGEAYDGLKEFRAPVVYGKSEMLYEESEIALVALGSMVKTAELVRHALHEMGYRCTLVNARFAKPLDEELLLRLEANHRLIATLEENVISGGFGEHVTEFLSSRYSKAHVVNIAIPDEFVEHGNVDILRRVVQIDEVSATERILAEYQRLDR